MMQLTKYEGAILKKVQKYGGSGFIMATHIASCIKCIIKDSIGTVPHRCASVSCFLMESQQDLLIVTQF